MMDAFLNAKKSASNNARKQIRIEREREYRERPEIKARAKKYYRYVILKKNEQMSNM